MAFASGGFSDVQKGILGGQLVAVKVMRMALDKNLHELQKVRCTGPCFCIIYSDPRVLVAALLQGDRPLEEHLSPKYPWPHRGRDRQLHRELLDDLGAHGERQHLQFHPVQLSKPASSGNWPLVLYSSAEL